MPLSLSVSAWLIIYAFARIIGDAIPFTRSIRLQRIEFDFLDGVEPRVEQ